MKSTFASFTFGCRVNQAEKETLDRELIRMGFIYAADNPQYSIINTCAVTNKAEREAKQLIYQTKRKNPKTIIVVTGCAATKWIKEGRKIEGVDLTIDNINKKYIIEIINSKFEYRNSKQKKEHGKGTGDANECIPDNASPSLSLTKWSDFEAKSGTRERQDPSGYLIDNKFLNSGRYYLKIQDGCQRFCTFCIVPYLRGQPESERIMNLVLRIKNLDNNIKEVILTAINTQAYGFDTEEKLTDLITAILNKTKIERLSFGSIHPWSIDNEFLSLYKKLRNNQRFAKFLHIPLQSGSNKILDYMKRGYTREELLEKLKTIERIYPLTFIGTDIITGFLEETDKDFQETYNFLEKSPISKFHVFRFSKRDKTAAFYMSKKLKEPSSEDKTKRSKALIVLSQNKFQKFLSKHMGQSFPALILEKKVEDLNEALLLNQIPVLVKASNNDIATIKMVKVVKQYNSKLIASLVN